MKYKIDVYSIHELGQRQNQEDSIYPALGNGCAKNRHFIVCDGMGGHDAGEVASNAVCQAMNKSIIDTNPDSEGFFSDDDFQVALACAYDELDRCDTGSEKKMGTTMTFLKLHDGGAIIAHIGDSRVYHFRPGKDKFSTQILFVTRDHSLVNDLIKIGELTPEQARHSSQRNVITRAMQPNMDRRPKADIYHTKDIKPGDCFLLCTDGIIEDLEDENLQYLFSDNGNDDTARINMLKQMTNHHRDNHSAILVRVLDVECNENVSIEKSGSDDNIKSIADNTIQKSNRFPVSGKAILNAVLLTVVTVAFIVALIAILKTSDEPIVADDINLNIERVVIPDTTLIEQDTTLLHDTVTNPSVDNAEVGEVANIGYVDSLFECKNKI